MTVLTPPLAVSLPRAVSLHEQSNGRQSSDAAGFTDPPAEVAACEQKPPLPEIIISVPADDMIGDKAGTTGDKAGSTLCCEIASDDSRAVNMQHDNSKQVLHVKVDNKAASEPPPVDQHNDKQLDVHQRSAKAVDLCTKSHADGSLVACVARDTNVNISDNSFHLDTQMLCAVACPAANEDNKITNIVQSAVPKADGDQLMSESVMDMSSELDGLGPNSATCQFMKEFSTQKCAAQTNAAIAGCSRSDEGSRGCTVSLPVETVRNPLEPQISDLSVNNTPELVASSNFDRIYAAGRDEANRQIVYSEEMLFDDGDEGMPVTGHLPVAGEQNDRLSAGLNNGITSDLAEKFAADDCIENKSDLFASYVEEMDAAVRTDTCSADLPVMGSSFVLAHDSFTSTMFDRAMAAVNQATVVSQLNTVRCPPAAGAGNADAIVVIGNQRENPQTDVLPSRNTDLPEVDVEAALHLLCETSRMSAKKPPKRRGRKRNSDSVDLLRKSGTSDVEEKRLRVLSRSPGLPVEGERSDMSLNQAVCFSVSFGSTSDSSAYVPPTPPSTATEKSNINTPRRLLGGVIGITPVKPDQSLHQVCEVKKNTVQSKGRGVEEMSQHEASGIAHAAVGDHEVKVGGSVPPSTQGLQSTQSFTIIDVAANRLLFDTFIAEWQQRTSFSLSLACEKRPKPQAQHSRRSSEGIGARFAGGKWINDLSSSNSIGRTVFRFLMHSTVFFR